MSSTFTNTWAKIAITECALAQGTISIIIMWGWVVELLLQSTLCVYAQKRYSTRLLLYRSQPLLSFMQQYTV